MSMKKIFSLPKPVYFLLLLCNIILAVWLKFNYGSFFGWTSHHFEDITKLVLGDFLSIFQILLLALTFDMSIRFYTNVHNERSEERQIPGILIEAVTVVTYLLTLLLLYVMVYDKSFTNIIAASGMVVVGIAYAFREMIANIMASVQIQLDGLITINDYIEVIDTSPSRFYKVTQLDKLMITLYNEKAQYIRIPNRQFLSFQYVNLSKQPDGSASLRLIYFDLDATNDVTLVINALFEGMHSLMNTNPDFPPGYLKCTLNAVNHGSYQYLIKYKVSPHISKTNSDGFVNIAVTKALLSHGVISNTAIELLPSRASIDNVEARLLSVKQFGILKDLSNAEIKQLANTVSLRYVDADDYLIRHGEAADSMFIILSGSLEVMIPKDNAYVSVATLWPSNCIGEMSLMTGEPRSAHVIAKSDSTLIEIKKSDIEPILAGNKKLLRQMAELLSQRVAVNERVLNEADKIVAKANKVKALVSKIASFFKIHL
jgi:CRP-like cAMP-binding protein/small-conductance mechanosensitive channel